MNLNANNNNKVVKHLAVRSIKSNKMRNTFVVITIALSVSLLMVLSLFIVGLEKSKSRLVSNMQHVIYHQVTKVQLDALLKDKRVDILRIYKSGTGIEVNHKMIQPIWFGEEALKGDSTTIDTYKIIEGKAPINLNEIAVSKGYCKLIGVEPVIGTNITLNFLDGSTEEFIITGLIDIKDTVSIYPILFSNNYAMEGKQLKNILPDAIVRIVDANNMSQSEFLEEIRDIAASSGVERKHVNENNYFLDTLSGGERQSDQIIVIVCISIGILFVSILVIYSVFYLSVIGRVRQFGQFRTLGMTKRQIKKMITKEGLLLSAIGIPIGIVIGGIIGYLVQRSGWDWENTFKLSVLIIIADALTVLISIRKPAKIAAMISPIESSKYSGYADVKEKVVTKRLHRKITPFRLARMSVIRNRKKFILTTVSLGVGGVLFLLATTFITSTSLEEYSRQGEFQYGEFFLSLSSNVAKMSEHGIADMQVNNPLNDELITQLLSLKGVREITSIKNATMRWEAKGEVEKDIVVGFSKEDINAEYLEAGSYDYDKMVAEDEIFIYDNDIFEEVFGFKYMVGDKVNITVFDGRNEVEHEYTVAGYSNNKRFKNMINAGWFLMPEQTLNQITMGMNLTTGVIISTTKENRDTVEEHLRNIVTENPLLTINTLKERKQIDEASFSLIFGMILGLSLFIIGFSIINLVNTLLTNIVTKKQEYAMFESLGMTNRQLTAMIQMEGLWLSVGNILITLIIGVPLAYGGIELLRYFGAEYMHFNFPIWFFLAYIIATILVPIAISAQSIYNFKKQSLVERVRMVDM